LSDLSAFGKRQRVVFTLKFSWPVRSRNGPKNLGFLASPETPKSDFCGLQAPHGSASIQIVAMTTAEDEQTISLGACRRLMFGQAGSGR
jgi:hypothetical protein